MKYGYLFILFSFSVNSCLSKNCDNVFFEFVERKKSIEFAEKINHILPVEFYNHDLNLNSTHIFTAGNLIRSLSLLQNNSKQVKKVIFYSEDVHVNVMTCIQLSLIERARSIQGFKKELTGLTLDSLYLILREGEYLSEIFLFETLKRVEEEIFQMTEILMEFFYGKENPDIFEESLEKKRISNIKDKVFAMNNDFYKKARKILFQGETQFKVLTGNILSQYFLDDLFLDISFGAEVHLNLSYLLEKNYVKDHRRVESTLGRILENFNEKAIKGELSFVLNDYMAHRQYPDGWIYYHYDDRFPKTTISRRELGDLNIVSYQNNLIPAFYPLNLKNIWQKCRKVLSQ